MGHHHIHVQCVHVHVVGISQQRIFFDNAQITHMPIACALAHRSWRIVETIAAVV